MAPLDTWPPRLPQAFYVALEEFNRGEYFACHETLEALWLAERSSVRELYQGVVQIAVGCYHLTQRGNWAGAVGLLDRGARRLERALSARSDVTKTPHDARHGPSGWGVYGVDWRALIRASDEFQAHLRALGRDKIARYDPGLAPGIAYSEKRD